MIKRTGGIRVRLCETVPRSKYFKGCYPLYRGGKKMQL